MKSIKFLAGALLLALAVASCKDKNSFTVSGTLEHPGSVKSITLIARDTNGLNIIDSTHLGSDGKFEFKHNGPYAKLYRLRVGGVFFDLIAENGQEITFKTDMADKDHKYEISGSIESLKIQEFNSLANSFNDRSQKLQADYEAAVEKKGKETDSITNIYRPQFIKIQDDYNVVTLKWVRNNEVSLAAFYAALSVDPMKYERQLIAYADDLGVGFKDNPLVEAFKKQMADVKPISVGHKAPDFTIDGLNGKPVSLSDYSGKYVMLDFWASWCGPCRAEMPNVVKQYAAYKDKGLNILGISLDEQRTDWEKGLADLHMTWPQASDLKKWEGPTELAYRVQGIPANFIIDPDGVIVAKNLAGADLEDFLNKTFAKSK